MRVPVLRSTLVLTLCFTAFSLQAEAANRFCLSGPNKAPTFLDGSGFYTQGSFRVGHLNPGQPPVVERRFITAISYFGAMAPGHDPTVVLSALCDRGFNGVRIFADFWRSPPGQNCSNTAAFLPQEYAVIDVNGNLNKTTIPLGETRTPFAKLLWVLTKAKEYGLVVDLSFAHEVVQGRSYWAHQAGIEKIAQELQHNPDYDHVMFDVQNEFNSVGCPTRSNWRPYIATSISHTIGYRDTRPVTASTAADPAGGLLYDLQAVVAGSSSILAVHEDRGSTGGTCGNWWTTCRWDQIIDNIGLIDPSWVYAKPLIYAQEPCAAQYVPCLNPSADKFYQSLRHAFRKGLAGWVFHTEALFYPGPGPTIGSGWTTAEWEFLGLAASPYTVFTAIQGQCWGDLKPSWIASCGA